MASLESLLFVPSPKTQVESNLDDEMSIHITKELSRKTYENTKDRSNHSIVNNEQKNEPNCSNFIETTIKESFRGTESRGSKSKHLFSPNKPKCDLNDSNLAEKEKDKSTDQLTLPRLVAIIVMMYKLVHGVKTVPVRLVEETIRLELEMITILLIEHWIKTPKMSRCDFFHCDTFYPPAYRAFQNASQDYYLQRVPQSIILTQLPPNYHPMRISITEPSSTGHQPLKNTTCSSPNTLSSLSAISGEFPKLLSTTFNGDPCETPVPAHITGSNPVKVPLNHPSQPDSRIPTIFACNIRSLAPKIDGLECVVNQYESDIVCITET